MELNNVKIVIVGHVDHGKSTLIGRLMYDTDCLPKAKFEEIKKSSESIGKDTEFAFVMDHLEEERKRGITIDTAQIFFKTQNRRFVIIDTPGHKEFLKNMITGSSMAEAAFLIIDADEGIMDQTKRHCYLLHMLGFKNIIVVVNKMDLVKFSENVFIELKKQIIEYLKDLDINVEYIVPISAKLGENIVKRSSNMEWYKEEPFLEILDKFEIKRHVGKNLCFVIQDIYDFVRDESIIVGKVESGVLNTNSEVTVLPENFKSVVSKIEKYNQPNITSSEAGDCIGIKLTNGKDLKRGQVLVNESFAKVSKEIHGNIFWMSKYEGKLNDNFTFKCSTQSVNGKIAKILKKFDPASLEVVDVNTDFIKDAEIAEVIIETDSDVVTNPYIKVPSLGRFVLEKNENVVAGGIII